MKYQFFTLAFLTLTTSCDLRPTNFDPDNQLVSLDEQAQIAGWENYSIEKLSQEEYELSNPDQFVKLKYDYRQTAQNKWIIEGSVTNFAQKANFKDVALIVSYYSLTNTLIGTEEYSLFDYFSPGGSEGFYFKSAGFEAAHSVSVEIDRVTPMKQ